MPLVRISVPAAAMAGKVRALADAVHQAMVETVDVPPTDRFQIINRHDADHLLIDPSYFGVSRSADAAIVHITFRRGRTDAQKRALYAAIVHKAKVAGGIREADIMVVLAENERIDWSFGDGIAQMSPDRA
jgi:4-oxalocrotonate tautomerase